MKRWVATAAIMLGLLGVAITPAHADPINAPNVEPFPITCDGTTYTVVVPGATGRGAWTPALVTTSNVVLVPFSFEFTVTNLTTGDIVFQEAVSKEAAEATATTTCSFQETFTEGGETFQLVGVVEVLSQPLG